MRYRLIVTLIVIAGTAAMSLALPPLPNRVPVPKKDRVFRWPAKATPGGQQFSGEDFKALDPAPPTDDGPFTISVWVTPADLASGDANYGRGIARSTRSEKIGDWVLSVHPDGKLDFCNWRTIGDDSEGRHVTDETVVTVGAWHHIVAVWDGKKNRLFVNGVEATYTSTHTSTNWGDGHEVGRSWTQPGYYWDGKIDDLRVHRRALTAAEIAAAFKSAAQAKAVKPAGNARPSTAAVSPPAPTNDPIVRWPSRAEPGGYTFGGGEFIALNPAPTTGDGPFTISVWVNAADLASGDASYGRGIARSTRSEKIGDWLLSVHPDGRLAFCNWRTNGDDQKGRHITRAPVVTTDAWHHIAASWDGKTNRLFVNGVEAKYTSVSTAAGWGDGHEVGRGWIQPGYYWDGLIDDLRVYRRTLTSVEMTALGKSAPQVQAAKASGPAGDPKTSAAIDRFINDQLKQNKLAPAPPADDAEFLRRVCLDLVGRIPTVVETEAFLADRAADKRTKLIETLLAGREMPMAWAQILSGWLMPDGSRRDPQFVAYLRNNLARNKPWNQLAREMIVARPEGTGDQGAMQFLSLRKAALADRSIATSVGRAFFGVNLRCAQCHDHPHVLPWTLERYYGLSAFFARTFEHTYTDAQKQKHTVLAEKASGEWEYTAEGKKKTAVLMLLDGTKVAEPAAAKDAKEPPPSPTAAPPVPAFSRREALARAALGPGSTQFSRAIVNRVWKRLMGRGLVEPVDMMHDANPATHPELLQFLAADFAEHGFDLRRLIAVIAQSATYARGSRWPGPGETPDETLYALAMLKPLDADQLALSVPLAAGQFDAPLSAKKSMAQLRGAAVSGEVLGAFDTDAEEFEPTTAQALFLTNGEYVQSTILAGGNLVKVLSALKDDAALARRLYLTVLSREPTAREHSTVRDYLNGRGAGGRTEACRELVWALLSSAEFRFNH